ncbi:histidine kinase dimerization/phospho-acceptor domain-containing protein [Mucilaginibacter sp. Mucisp86]|uniref:PAS domain-containing sensor histidine kinase n=1 Tax=Mucilaginibacter sp. Mucisp86 TaxID=3243060 RepID=UPI0039B619E1
MEKITTANSFFKIANIMITPVIIINNSAPENQNLYCNGAFVAGIGYTNDELHDLQDWFQKAYPDPDYQNEIMNCRDKRRNIAAKYGRSFFHLETKVCCADGSYYWYDIYETQIDHLTVFTFLNIDELERQNNKLGKTVQQKNLLLSMVKHDVRNPLSHIKMLLDSLSNQHTDIEREQFERIIYDLGRHVDYATHLLNTVLHRTEIERGTFTFQPVLIDLKPFLITYYQNLKPRLAQKNIRLYFKPDFPKLIFYDRFILETAFVNIINYIIGAGKHDGDIVISGVEGNYFSSLIITDERLPTLGNRKLQTYSNTNPFPAGYDGLINAEKMLAEHSGKLLTHKKRYGAIAWEIRINKYNVL